jgi:hypothetical protein
MFNYTFTTIMLIGMFCLTFLAFISRFRFLIFVCGLGILLYGFTLGATNLMYSILVVVFGLGTMIFAFLPQRSKR